MRQPCLALRFVCFAPRGLRGDAADGKMPLSLTRLAEICDRPQASQSRIDKGEQMRDNDIVEKHSPISVTVVLSQVLHQFFQHPNVLAAGNVFGSVRQRFQGFVFGYSRILRDLDRGRKMS
jgi:hypothetical protein